MSLQVLATPALTQHAKPDANRHLANFHRDIWGDYFLSSDASDSMETDEEIRHLQLKVEIKRMLMAHVNKPSQKLDLIDAIQRLGVSYHFEHAIDELLEKIHDCDLREDDDDDLYSISLQFRLLRQHGFKISCDVFNKFKDINGNFKASLTEDVRGMLSLYEAAHLRVHGEIILDEALAFTMSHLETVATQLNSPLTAQVNRAINRPLRKSLPRLEARHYMAFYQQDPSHSEALLTFAKLDFNMLQKLHQRELSDILRWWRSFDVPNKLPFIRDRMVECYFWILGVYFEPQYLLGRRILGKVVAMSSIIDDIYDAYGTLEELELFTTAIERWDISAIDQLPEYMKLCYGALLDMYSEFENDLAKEGNIYRLPYAKEAMKNLARNYMIEARWCDQGYIPTMEKYMSIALSSCGYLLLATSSFMGMGDMVTKESMEWVSGNPKIIKASSVICRLMDDMVSHKFEQKRGHVASAVECYMKQHGVSEDEVEKVFRQEVANAWKDINEEFLRLRPTGVPMALMDRVLNLARLMDVLYKDGDSYTNPHLMKDHVAALLKDPVMLI
ncbi:Linalool synthase [Melia azedarach]|uniref:Linalool synthase n=1 Tax=Melia azedarach TaxID=155640 RepID=A0ACC1YQY8_MELAZ|nr:Linalool synthase [Melia azedarach]